MGRRLARLEAPVKAPERACWVKAGAGAGRSINFSFSSSSVIFVLRDLALIDIAGSSSSLRDRRCSFAEGE